MDIQETNAWVTHLDVFGFKALNTELGSLEVAHRLRKLMLKIFEDEDVVNSTKGNLYLFSDSLFTVFPVEEQSSKGVRLQQSLEFLQRIMGYFADEQLPLRGGMAYGLVCKGSAILVGDPIMRAVDYEKMIPAPFLLLPEKELTDITAAHRPTSIWRANIELKDNQTMSGCLIHPAPVDSLLKLARDLGAQCREKGPHSVATAWLYAEKYIQQLMEEAGQ